MWRGWVMILAAVVLTGVTGCADRPNNLETYYDKPGNSPSPEIASPPVTTPGATPGAAGSQPPVSSTDNVVAQEVIAAVLTTADLVHEGVRAAATRPPDGACFDAVPAGDPRGASWLYNSGSSLVQQVTGYLDKSATDVLGHVQCGGQPLAVPLPSGATVVRGWCQDTTCTVLLASGHVLSGLQVTAGTVARAAEAVRSLAPIAAAKLPSS